MLKIGHRGARGYAPENTLASFKKAIELGVDVVELDVQLCKSGELVVIHDYTVDRTTDGSGFVEKLEINDLKKLDAGMGERIPTLEEVLDLVDRRVKVNIELKGPKTAKPVIKLVEEYISKNGWNEDDFMISSFSRKELKIARSLSPTIRIGILISIISVFRIIDRWSLRFAKKINASFIGLSLKIVSKKLVRKAHNQGLKIFVRKINEVKNIKKIKNLNIDGIFSDYPDRLTKAI